MAAPIAGPSIIRITIQSAFAFDGKLSIIELSAGQLIAAMENSVSRAPAADGRFPMIAGMIMEVDLSKPPIEGSKENAFQDQPSRIKSLIVSPYNGTDDTVVSNYTARGDLSRTYVMATNVFLLTGGDAYFAFTEATVLASTELGEQQLFEEYVKDELDSLVDIPDPPPKPARVQLLRR